MPLHGDDGGFMLIRNATMADLSAIAEVERRCFPVKEAATEEEFRERLAAYADCFWLLFDGGRLVSFIDGMATDEADLRDEMYADASLHKSNGRWQMIFGLNTLPEFRRRGYAALLVRTLTEAARERGKLGVVLTCKEKLIPYYASLGFENEGLSSSTHGDVAWYQMRLRF